MTRRPTPVPTQLFSVGETAKRLGLGISKTWTLVWSGELRSVKVGSRRLVSDAAIADFITAHEDQQSA